MSFLNLLMCDFMQAKEIPGIKIFRSSATIYYTNAEMFLEVLQEKVCGCVFNNLCSVCVCVKSASAFYSTLNCFHYLSHSSHFLSSFCFNVMLGSCCRLESRLGSCYQQRRNEMQSRSVDKRKRKRKPRRRQKNKYEI